MIVSNSIRRPSAMLLDVERQRYYSQAVAACLARLQRCVDLLQQPLLSELQQAGLQRDIDDQTLRLNTLVRHVLTAAGLSLAADRQGVGLGAVVTSLVHDYRALRPDQPLTLRLTALPETAGAAVPCVLLVLQLLLDNALRRTPGGQPVTVTGAGMAEDQGWVFRVQDAGASLSPQQMAVLFDDPSQAGPGAYGLGLTLARYLVEALGGRLWADSEPGAGTTFAFSLPRPVLLRRWTVTRPKVLLIEKDGALSAALRAGYEEAGFEVQAASSTAAGLALIPEFAPSLILLELSASLFDGRAGLAALRQCSNAAVICLVAPDHRALVADALWQGATDCLVKPFNIRELLARTRAILRRQPAAHPLAAPATRRPHLPARPSVNPLLQ